MLEDSASAGGSVCSLALDGGRPGEDVWWLTGSGKGRRGSEETRYPVMVRRRDGDDGRGFIDAAGSLLLALPRRFG